MPPSMPEFSSSFNHNKQKSSQERRPSGSSSSSHENVSPSPPTMQEIDTVRQTWERVCERRHMYDDPSVSAAHAFGLCFFTALFALDPLLKSTFGNVLQQARALAEIMAYLTRSPSIKGQVGPLRDQADMTRQYDPDVCPFHQPLEEKFQQQPDQQEKQKKRLQEHQQETQWFAYKLREVGIHYVEDYDLMPAQLDSIGPALMTALKARLKDEFTPHIKQTWTKVYTFTFHHMKTGMDAHMAYHRRAKRLSSGSYCSVEAGETNGVCTIQ
ncbi:uncharacterized protein BX664DRAFT_354357 [Halteromyces radiatus]|uniref:uncharacterized protein n=1 Tax=Halteromyces radiatus TaxID=101107 RepID=UPI002220E3AB|nr:uncharacterized protein BX664DRAFT_354357 [Halteromyces radiatus]KAI8098839.1 hypothetical protein BX664DRAFT_354357 [Halteromyces radiatus]